MSDFYLTEKEAAKVLSLSPRTLSNWRAKRVGPPWLKLEGKIVRYSMNRLREWMSSNIINLGDVKSE